MRDRQTIIQLATPRATGAIHIIRISGDKSLAFLKKHITLKEIKPRKTYYTSFYHQKKIIDKLIFFYSASPYSYTGEDMVELHVHGSLLIVEEVLKIALEEDLVLAEPGEFSERAFLNGKMTLEMAEATNGLIHTRSSYLKENALRILEKKSSLEFAHLENLIQSMMAELESSIEFPEEDIPEIDKSREELYFNYLKKIEEITEYFEKIASNFLIGSSVSEGIKVGFLGAPNVGKSTLLNTLLQEDRVLVSPEAGTTRDFISENFTIDEFPLLFLDTAGIRKTQKSLEKKGILKTLEIIKKCEIIIILLDSLQGLEKIIAPSFLEKNHLQDKHFLVYINKTDILLSEDLKRIKKKVQEKNLQVKNSFSLIEKPEVSRKIIITDLKEILDAHFQIPQGELALVSHRQYIIVNRLIEKLSKVKQVIKNLAGEEIVIEEFRKLKDDFSELNLNTDQEEIFNTLFRQFCIGK